MIDLFVGMVYNFSFSLPKTSEFFIRVIIQSL